MITKNSIGIDIQDDKIFLVWLQSRMGKTRLVESRTISVPEGGSRAESLEKAGKTINQFIKDEHIASPEIYLAFPGEKAVVRTLKFPLSIKENFRETIRYELEKYVPFSEEQVYHDSRILAEDRKKKEVIILLTVVKKEDFTPYLRMGEHLGSGVSGLESTYSALGNGLSALPGTASLATYAYYHKSEPRHLVVLLHHNRLLSGRSLGREAESHPAEMFFPELKICKNRNLGDGGPLTVLTAQASDLPEGGDGEDDEFTVAELDTGEVPSAQYIPAYGLALKGLQKVPMQINLMPRGLRKRPDRKALYLVYALIAVNILLALTWSGSALVKKKTVLEDLDRRISRVKTDLKDLTSLENEVEKKRARIAFLNNFQEDHPPAIVLLNELTGVIPKTAWLNTFRLFDGTLEIRGVAGSASDLLPILESSPLFSEAAFTSSINKTGDGKEEFQIKLRISDYQ